MSPERYSRATLGLLGAVIGVIVVSVVAVAIVWGSSKDEYRDDLSASTTTVADEGLAPSVTPSTAPVGSAMPTVDNTGPTTAEGELERVTPEELEDRMEPGAVIEGVYVTGGDVDVTASDVTLRDFVIDGDGARYGIVSCGTDADCESRDWPGGFVAEDGIVRNVASSGVWGGGVTVRRVEVHDSGGDAFKPLDDVTIESSYGHSLGTKEGAHADFIQFQAEAERVTIRGNNCALGLSTLQGKYLANACVQVNRQVPVVDALVEGNWLEGGNYTVNCSGPAAAGVRFEGNTLGDDFQFGVNTGCTSWSGNTYADGSPAE
jgi:hypothetical protein